MGLYAGSLAWKTSLRSQDAVALQRVRAWRFTYDWSWWYPSGNRPLRQYLGFTCRALVMVSSSMSWPIPLHSKKRAERSEIDVWTESPRLSPLWCYTSSSLLCGKTLIITVSNAIACKAQPTKMPENWSWRTRQLLTCRCVSVMLLRSMQNTWRGVSWCKAKWCSAWWCCRWSSSVARQSDLSVSAWSARLGVDIHSLPPTGICRAGYFTLRGWSLCKNKLEGQVY